MYSFCPSDYLAIRTAPEILQLTFDSEDTVNYYRNLEKRIARFFGTESAIFFPDAYLAFVALLRNLVQEDDFLLIPSVTDGMIMDSIEILQRQFENIQVRVLTEDWAEHVPTSASRVVILGNGICENTCSVAPLDQWTRQLNHLWEKFQIPGVVILDDSLAVGLLGPNARGTFDLFGLPANKVPNPRSGIQYFFSASLAEAFGASGGFIPGKQSWLRKLHRTEPSCCSKNEFPLSNVVAAEKAVELAEDLNRRKKLKENVQILYEQLKKYEISYDSNDLLPFVLIKVSSPKDVLKGMILRGCRIGVTHFTKKPKICLAVNSDHTEKEIEYLAQNLRVVLDCKKE